MESHKSVFDKIEDIRIKRRLGVTEFLQETNISRGTYYRIKEDSNNVTDKIIYKLIETYPEYKYEYFVLNDTVSESTETYSTSTPNNDEFLDSLARQVQDNWEELSKRESFKGFFYYKVAQVLNMDIDKIFADAVSKGQ